MKWIKPPPDFVKLNSDRNIGKICGGGGGVMNNSEYISFALAVILGEGTTTKQRLEPSLIYDVSWSIINVFSISWLCESIVS